MKNQPILTSTASLMLGRQRLATRLELSSDNVLRLFNKKDDVLLFESPAQNTRYSSGKIIKSRLRLVGSQNGVRIGVTNRDEWIKTLKQNGALQDPKRPEEKLDMYGLIALGIFLLVTIVAISIPLISK